MGDDSWLLGMVCFETVGERTVEQVLSAFLENGFTADVDTGESAEAVAARIREDSESSSDSRTSEPHSSVEVWYNTDYEYDHSKRSYSIDFRLSQPADNIAPVTIMGPGAWVDHTKQDHDVQALVEALVDAFEALSEAIDPWVAVLAIMPDGRKIPDGHPPEHGIEKLPFVTVFGSEMLSHLGGREHVLATPVYETRSLDTGGVLVRTRDMPIVKFPLEEGPSGSPEKHLFEGLSAEDRNRFVDPVHELSTGELATDLVLCESHAPFEWKAMDYTAFPELPERDEHCHVLCVRREDEKLWEAHNGEFIRRLVAEDGNPSGTSPTRCPLIKNSFR